MAFLIFTRHNGHFRNGWIYGVPFGTKESKGLPMAPHMDTTTVQLRKWPQSTNTASASLSGQILHFRSVHFAIQP